MKYKYDIAISYKSDMEKTAAKIYDYLIMDGWNIFYSPAEQQEVLSEKIHQMLYGIYKNESFLKILLISESYLEGEWTNLEKRVSLESTKEDRKRLLVVSYIDQKLLPEDVRTLLCLDGRKMKEDEIACLITERLNKYINKDVEKSVRKDTEKGKDQSCIIINKGIMTGNNAHFENIQL